MQTFLAGPLPDNARNLMRRLGYGEHIGHGGQLSYTKRISGEVYPHYHAYIEDKNGGIQINLHLDQKPSNLGSGAMHAGEYEGPLVEKEMTRLRNMVSSMSAPPSSEADPEEKKGFWGGLFG
ncbi:MAG: hypothetical protein UX09_C0024G0013 [Candidatus Uhrbacteria bacterium GW2011_GWE2_45_35]|uniref:Uncharacterized protein n=2 Tax=Candidatus Uhriibacteriota TaxID=1752732 RepID=A0A0G1M806_9BACT|nr:MAG: hypothetical protein UW63_C0089G0010 [Candidatus Uhrbacteria bacterium GW2011_GWF2_44_350]KKU07788.1 MAG: hypothetical protein UX09_C0024G0013 [Candidatus Uhrbacteria bacterium GW2011_GWE2_45_35]HBR81043.1 hypothetical protein [Candidatus Uhrbacteria bacterium]HCU32057.1 hypothetical protein [Candidatus Uhrbacteria bacterium]